MIDEGRAMTCDARCDQVSGTASLRQAALSADPLTDVLTLGKEEVGDQPNSTTSTRQPKAQDLLIAHKHGHSSPEQTLPAIDSHSNVWSAKTERLGDSSRQTIQLNPLVDDATLVRGNGGSGPSITSNPLDVGSAKPLLPPVQQISSAVAAIHSGADGSSHITIHLDPGELGSVQVRIARAHDGVTSVSVAVERPETLRTLQADLNSLHHALDRAGLADQRSVVLHLATPNSSSNNHPSSSQGDKGGQPQHGGARQQRSGSIGRADTVSNESAKHRGAEPALLHWFRAGVNITA